MRSSHGPSRDWRSSSGDGDDASTEPAESPIEIVWSDFAFLRNPSGPAENGPILPLFSIWQLTGPKDEDCYTFEHFASSPDVIHTYYYYHYKRIRIVLKEETTWS
jgi:hypothetical protein